MIQVHLGTVGLGPAPRGTQDPISRSTQTRGSSVRNKRVNTHKHLYTDTDKGDDADKQQYHIDKGGREDNDKGQDNDKDRDKDRDVINDTENDID